MQDIYCTQYSRKIVPGVQWNKIEELKNFTYIQVIEA